ncbi:microfibril-associated glycoprotein 4-like isoform X2 [Saccostrea cucullata]|uniref:microfibril-associated glycoprotein 4-like isoform X2 n=1 Tax=Saccostrea cuccullata TaxID=36930 RepID=UPI002ED1F125
MTGVYVAIFVYVLFVCTASCQQIYSDDKNYCDRNDQTIEILNEKIEYLRQENAKQIDSLKQEIARIKKNETNIHEDLKSSILETIKSELYKDCKNLYIHGNTESGVYEIYPFGNNSKVSVFCDMMTEGGGWTAIQKRVSGSVSFDRTWTDYKTGFGNPNGSYWIGNDVIHQLTKRRNSSLYVSITLTNGTRLYELYNQFSVADETNNYRLFLGGPATGTLDGMNSGHDLSGMSFSTPDRDNDGYSRGNCAGFSNTRGGWWFNYCHRAFLNGQWSPGSWVWPWYPTVTDSTQIKETLMMLKPT